jgi:SAM-dependent methyltransferase
MHATIEGDNPFGHDRYGFAWQQVPADGAAHLDFGCGDGSFLAALKAKGISRLVGVDADRDAVVRAEERDGALEIHHIGRERALPFADQEFSSVTMMDVLEHVHKQGTVLDEVSRVLRDDGILIVTVPGRHVLSFLDLGNLKFRFPRLHRWHYCRTHSTDEYERRYEHNPDGLVGDVSAEKRWHEHFSRRGLERLLNEHGFSVTRFDGTGCFLRVLKIARIAVGYFGPLQRAIEKLMAWDARRFGSANLFCVARKTVRAHQVHACES